MDYLKLIDRGWLQIGRVEIPPIVAFSYMLAVQSPIIASPIPALNLPKAPKDLKTLIRLEPLPVVCWCCRRLAGICDGGRMLLGCPHCAGAYADPGPFWKALSMANCLLDDWACEPLYCFYLGQMILDGRPKTGQVSLPNVLEVALAEAASRPKEPEKKIKNLSAKDIAALLEEL